MNEVEQECIILNSAWAMIDSMVNWAMFVKHDYAEPTSLMFETSYHARLFNILLADFLSQLGTFKRRPVPLGLKAPPRNARPSDLTFLLYLRQVCEYPRLGSDVAGLRKFTEDFAKWLEEEILVTGVNLPDIDVIADLRVSRYRYIKLCGDIAKHNLPRLAGNIKYIQDLLGKSGNPINEQNAYLAIHDFFKWFHEYVFIYHSSVIGEFLNNIQWSIFEYLQTEYDRSYEIEGIFGELPIYRYNYPADCSEPIAKSMYWDLMNRVRLRPWIPRFVIADAFKSRY